MWKRNVLVVANVTADSDELMEALRDRARHGPCAFRLVVPMHGVGPDARAAAHDQLSMALEKLRDDGLQVDGLVGDNDPITAVMEAFDPTQVDEIVVSTLPSGTSRWLALDLPHRIEKMTQVPTRHIEVDVREPVLAEPAPERERSPLGPLAVLGWGHR